MFLEGRSEFGEELARLVRRPAREFTEVLLLVRSDENDIVVAVRVRLWSAVRNRRLLFRGDSVSAPGSEHGRRNRRRKKLFLHTHDRTRPFVKSDALFFRQPGGADDMDTLARCRPECRSHEQPDVWYRAEALL